MLVTIRRALLSVSDKTGLIDFARALVARNVELLQHRRHRARCCAMPASP